MTKDWKMRDAALPANHPLCGRVVEIRAFVHSSSDEDAVKQVQSWDEHTTADGYVIVFDDGREVELMAEGYEVEGVGCTVREKR